MKNVFGLPCLLGGALLLAPMASNATIIYDTWTSVNGVGGGGNYVISVTHNVSQFDINFTVNPWNAEGLGGDGLVDRTLREAREMAAGSVSEDKVRRMSAWFARHLVDLDRQVLHVLGG